MSIFFEAIKSIFFDTDKNLEQDTIFAPQELTDHYRDELWDMAIDWVFVATSYNNIKESIEAYKYRSDRQHVWQYVDLLAKVVEKYSLSPIEDDIVIVSVPMHWSRYMIRGFNHIDLLARWLSERLWIAYQKPIRALFSKRQSKLSKKERMKNRESAYILVPSNKVPKVTILIDDIVSTGATANACAKILKNAGTEKIYAIFIASNY